jgi:hypothetical protein
LFACFALIAPLALKGARIGVSIYSRKPFFGIRYHRFEHDSVALFANSNFVPLEAKLLREAHCLAVAVTEKLGCLAHGLTSIKVYI